jgi:hypothetical protein
MYLLGSKDDCKRMFEDFYAAESVVSKGGDDASKEKLY